jgi:hypothetical protein
MNRRSHYKRLVILDPQFKDRKGHNYRYAKGIAAEMGLPCVVLAHESFRPQSGDELEVRPCLDFDQYDNSVFKSSFKPSLLARLDSRLQGLVSRLDRENALWPINSPLAQTLRFLARFLRILLFVPGLLMQLSSMLAGRGSSAIKDLTAAQLAAAFRSIQLREGDLLLFQTMLWPTFESLLELRVLRSQPYPCDALFIVHEDWLIYNTGYARFTPGKFRKRVLESLPFNSTKVVSTNRSLSDYCKNMCGYFPPVMKEIDFPVEQLPAKGKASQGTIRLLVPGTYRGDKNFESAAGWIEEVVTTHPRVQITFHDSVMARINPAPQYSDHYAVYSDIDGAGAWLEFLAGFDVILLPYGEAYRHRISGIIHEARLMDIPVVCSELIADAALLVNPECAFTDAEGSVATALENSLSGYREGGYYIEQDLDDISTIVSDAVGWVDFRDKPVAVQVKPAWTRCGTSVVLDAQMDYLVDRDFFLVEIYLKTEPWLATREQVEFMWQVMRGGREFSGGMLVRVLLKDVRLFSLLRYLWKLSRGGVRAFLHRENIHGTWCPLDTGMANFLTANPAELVLVNHVFNSEFAFRHIPGKRYICESHDVQINQLLMRRPELRARYEIELAYELDLLARYDGVVNLNRAEHLVISRRVGDKARFIRPPLLARPITMRYCSLRKLMEEQSKYPFIEELPEKFDLLIIGDAHPANVDSVSRFIRKVYPLLPPQTTVGIVGKVCQNLKVDWNEDRYENLHAVGFLDQLCNLYDFTSLLVLPDVAGEGIPIKTDEAISYGVPFVATRHALRGFSSKELGGVGIRAAQGDRELSRHIGEFMDDVEARTRLQAAQARLVEVHSMDQYFEEWDAVLELDAQMGWTAEGNSDTVALAE